MGLSFLLLQRAYLEGEINNMHLVALILVCRVVIPDYIFLLFHCTTFLVILKWLAVN